jgi:hypothetical protein
MNSNKLVFSSVIVKIVSNEQYWLPRFEAGKN